MSNLGNTTVCDGCDTDLGNGGLLRALMVSDQRDGRAYTFHFCRDRDNGNGGTIVGCASSVLRPEVLSAYAARVNGPLVASPEPAPPSPDPSLAPSDPSPLPPDVPDPTPPPTPAPDTTRKRTATKKRSGA